MNLIEAYRQQSSDGSKGAAVLLLIGGVTLATPVDSISGVVGSVVFDLGLVWAGVGQAQSA